MTGRLGRILGQGVLSACIALLTACATTPAPVDKPPAPADKPPALAVTGEVSRPAPAFTATDLGGRSFRLADYRGKNLVLVFYIGHQCQACVQQLGELQKQLAALRAMQAEVIAFASRNWQDVQTTQKALGLEFVLVAGPNVELMIRYGAYNPQAGVAKPVTMIVDKTGLIRWKYVGKDVNDRPSHTVILSQLKQLQ